jgi:hypothetical protein
MPVSMANSVRHARLADSISHFEMAKNVRCFEMANRVINVEMANTVSHVQEVNSDSHLKMSNNVGHVRMSNRVRHFEMAVLAFFLGGGEKSVLAMSEWLTVSTLLKGLTVLAILKSNCVSYYRSTISVRHVILNVC